MQQKENKLRTFFAIPVADEIIQDLESRAFEANPELKSKLRWSRRGNHHLTVRFLGEVSEKAISSFEQAALHSAANIQPFTLTIYKVARFPSAQGKIIAAHVMLVDELNKLYAPLEQACLNLGLQADWHPYKPHITLARAKGLKNFNFVDVLNFEIKLPVNQLVLYQSVPTERGTHYQPLHRFVF